MYELDFKIIIKIVNHIYSDALRVPERSESSEYGIQFFKN